MSIRPIDLQTMLLQLTQIGKEQSAAKEGAALHNALQNAAHLKKQEAQKEALHNVAFDEENPILVHPDEEHLNHGGKKHPESTAEDQNPDEPAKTETVKDPDLGTRLDLEG